MTSERPHDQRFWETDEWERGWTEMTQMLLLLHFCSPVCCVFREWTSTWVFVPFLVQSACVWVEDMEALTGMFVFTFIPHCVSTVTPLCICISPHVLVERLLAALCVCARVPLCVCARACVWVCVCVCVCGCWLYSRLLTLSDFVSGFLTHVLMAIKDFSLFEVGS